MADCKECKDCHYTKFIKIKDNSIISEFVAFDDINIHNIIDINTGKFITLITLIRPITGKRINLDIAIKIDKNIYKNAKIVLMLS